MTEGFQAGPSSTVEQPAVRQKLHRMELRDYFLLENIVLVFFLSRLAWLHWNIDAATYFEEEYRWVAALEILRGPFWNLLDYQADHYQGGSLVMILLATGLFQIFGPSPLVLKLAAILVSSGTLSLLYIVARKAFGRTTALLAGLAYLAGPPLVAFWGIVGMGSHTESVLFSLILILLFLRLFTGDARRDRDWFFFGLVAGLGLWFCYTSGLTLAACGLTWLLLLGIPRLRQLGAALLGVVVGMGPWLYYNLSRDFIGVRRILEFFGLEVTPDHWIPQTTSEKFTALVLQDWNFALLFPYQIETPSTGQTLLLLGVGVPLALALLGATARAILAVARWPRTSGLGEAPGASARRREVVFIVYGAIFLGFFLASNYTIDPTDALATYRLLVPPAVLLMIPAAQSAALAMARGGLLRASAIGGFAVFLLVASTTTIATAAREESGGRFGPGFGYMVSGLLLHRKYEGDLEKAWELARAAPTALAQRHTFRGVGWGLTYRYQQTGDQSVVLSALRPLSRPERAQVVDGIHWAIDAHAGAVHDQVRLSRPRPDADRSLERLQILAQLTQLPPARPKRAALPGRTPGSR